MHRAAAAVVRRVADHVPARRPARSRPDIFALVAAALGGASLARTHARAHTHTTQATSRLFPLAPAAPECPPHALRERARARTTLAAPPHADPAATVAPLSGLPSLMLFDV